MTGRSILRLICSAATFCGIFLWLWLGCPQSLTYQEQNQLFLFTWGYFAESVGVPGGFADWLSEFVVQFDYIPLYGALLTALLLTLTQVMLGLACRREASADCAYAAAALPPILFVAAMSDENVLLSYGAALTLTATALWLTTLPGRLSPLADFLMMAVVAVALYWLAGPVAVVFIIAGGILRRHPLAAAGALAVAAIAVVGFNALLLQQYPLSRLLAGINYYRVPEVYPAILFVIAAVSALVPLAGLLKLRGGRLPAYIFAGAVATFGVIFVTASRDRDKSSVLEYDSLVRQGRWDAIVEKARKEPPSHAFGQQALNLALGMKGQLTESMFRYPQNGLESLIGESRLDNTSQLISAEALYRLGLTNIAFATVFDLQEAIMNDRKSGRHTKRMAECMIINGNYEVARKYIEMLKHSLFYSEWARRAETLLGNDGGVEAHPVYGPLRRTAFREDGFYVHGQIDKILAKLAAGSGGSNTLAWDYFCAAAMLKCDLSTLLGVWNAHASDFERGEMPRHLQEAAALFWTSTHGNFDGMPFRLSEDVKTQTAALARAAMQHSGNPAAWEAAAPGSYGVYFLRQAAREGARSAAGYQSTHE
ncbi:MAG: hypothetical protein K2K93_02945 [Muribaculaceae bacterium]|nr:hypothetical protein [Muribaculaceae bacterium]